MKIDKLDALNILTSNHGLDHQAYNALRPYIPDEIAELVDATDNIFYITELAKMQYLGYDPVEVDDTGQSCS